VGKQREAKKRAIPADREKPKRALDIPELQQEERARSGVKQKIWRTEE